MSNPKQTQEERSPPCRNPLTTFLKIDYLCLTKQNRCKSDSNSRYNNCICKSSTQTVSEIWKKLRRFQAPQKEGERRPTFLCFIRFRVIEVGQTDRIHNQKIVAQNTIDIPLTIKAQQILRLNEVLHLKQPRHLSACQASTFHVAKQE